MENLESSYPADTCFIASLTLKNQGNRCPSTIFTSSDCAWIRNDYTKRNSYRYLWC